MGADYPWLCTRPVTWGGRAVLCMQKVASAIQGRPPRTLPCSGTSSLFEHLARCSGAFQDQVNRPHFSFSSTATLSGWRHERTLDVFLHCFVRGLWLSPAHSSLSLSLSASFAFQGNHQVSDKGGGSRGSTQLFLPGDGLLACGGRCPPRVYSGDLPPVAGRSHRRAPGTS